MKWLVWFLFMALASLSLQGQQGNRKPAQEGVTQLLKDLASPDFQLREQAQAALLRRGKKMVPLLKEARKNLPLEGRLRVDQLLDLLQKRETSPARQGFKPTLLTLDLKNHPFQELLEVLGSRAGTSLRLEPRRVGPTPKKTPPSSKEISRGALPDQSLETRATPFFKVLDTLCQRNGLVFRRDMRGGGIILYRGTPPLLPILYPGPLRVEMASFRITRQLSSSGQVYSGASIQLRVDAETGVPLLGILSPVLPTRVEDNLGRSLLLDQTPGRFYFQRASRARQFNLSFSIRPPKRDAANLRRVDFALQVLIPRARTRLVLKAPLHEGQASTGRQGTRIRLATLKKEGRGTRCVLLYKIQEPSGALPMSTPLNLPPKLSFFDREGQPLRPLQDQFLRRGRESGRRVLLPGFALSTIELEQVTHYEVKKLGVSFKNLRIP